MPMMRCAYAMRPGEPGPRDQSHTHKPTPHHATPPPHHLDAMCVRHSSWRAWSMRPELPIGGPRQAGAADSREATHREVRRNEGKRRGVPMTRCAYAMRPGEPGPLDQSFTSAELARPRRSTSRWQHVTSRGETKTNVAEAPWRSPESFQDLAASTCKSPSGWPAPYNVDFWRVSLRHLASGPGETRAAIQAKSKPKLRMRQLALLWSWARRTPDGERYAMSSAATSGKEVTGAPLVMGKAHA